VRSTCRIGALSEGVVVCPKLCPAGSATLKGLPDDALGPDVKAD